MSSASSESSIPEQRLLASPGIPTLNEQPQSAADQGTESDKPAQHISGGNLGGTWTGRVRRQILRRRY